MTDEPNNPIDEPRDGLAGQPVVPAPAESAPEPAAEAALAQAAAAPSEPCEAAEPPATPEEPAQAAPAEAGPEAAPPAEPSTGPHAAEPHAATEEPKPEEPRPEEAVLAGEVQEIIGRQVEELADRAVAETGRHGVKIRTDALAAQPRYLVRELVMTLWRRQQWPLQAMGFQEWDLLADMLLAPLGLETLGPCKRTFPGGVEAELREGVLRISGPTTES